jgi:hypothetical protein
MKSSTEPVRTDNIAMMPDEKDRMSRASNHRKAAKYLIAAASHHTQASKETEAGNNDEADKSAAKANEQIEAAMQAHKNVSKEHTVKS